MKQYWRRLVDRIDAMTLRERGMIFAATALAVVMLLTTFLLDPLFAKQKNLAQQVKQNQTTLAAVQSQIQVMTQASAQDPDKLNRDKLLKLQQQASEVDSALQGAEKNLVSQDRMAALLQDLLKRNGRLQLVALKTLPPSNLLNAEEAPAKPADKAAPVVAVAAVPADSSIYKHGVQLTVQGNYADLLNYLATLEAMPWRMFWGKVALDAAEYPKVNLTLTLYTLSLDKIWLSI